MGAGGSKGKTKNEEKIDLNNPISFTKDDLKEIKTNLKNIDQKISNENFQKKNTLRTINQNTEQNIALINDKISSINKEVLSIKNDISSTKSDISDLKTEISKMNKCCPLIQSEISNLKKDFLSLSKDISLNKSDISSIKEEIKSANENISSIKSDISLIANDISSTKSNFSNLNNDVSNMNNHCGSIGSDISNLKISYPKIITEISSVKSDVSSIKSEINIIINLIKDLGQNKLQNANAIIKNDIDNKQTEKNLIKFNIVKKGNNLINANILKKEKNKSLKEKLKQNKLDNKENLIKKDKFLNQKENDNENDKKIINIPINTNIGKKIDEQKIGNVQNKNDNEKKIIYSMPFIDNEKKTYMQKINDNSLDNKIKIIGGEISMIPSYIENKNQNIIIDYNNNINSQNKQYVSPIIGGPQFNNNQNEILWQKFELKPINTNIKIVTEDKNKKKIVCEIKSKNEKIIENNNEPKKLIKQEKEDPNLKEVIISMNEVNYTIKIKIDIKLDEFKNIVKEKFNINNITMIYYFNDFGTKIFINNELDFKNSLKQNILKFYISNIIEENKKEIILNMNIPKIPQLNKNFNNNDNTNNKNSEPKKYNNFLKQGKSEDESIPNKKNEIKEMLNHFASLSSNSNNNTGDIINNAVHVSDLINKLNTIEKANEPGKFLDSDSILKYPGLISDDEFGEKEKLYILALISKVLSEKGINVGIYKDKNSEQNLDGATLQYLFNGFTEKKKYELQFNLAKEKNDVLLKKGDELTKFIDEWKQKISEQLNIDKKELFLVNPKDKQGLCLDMVSNEAKIEYNKLKDFKEIKNVEEKSLIEGCQLSTDIFEPRFNNKDPYWGKGEKRAGKDYIPPEGWFGYGLKVSKKYDNGDDKWLAYSGNDGIFAIAYLGLSNIYGKKDNLNKFLNEIKIPEVLKMGYEQTYKNDANIESDSKAEYQKCGNGVYLFQDPKIAENTASIIDIGGVRYKILLMCRVNPKKIRTPQGFKDCWVLNPTPAEVRPYRILIKKIFQSPMSGASQNDIKVLDKSPDFFKDIIQKKNMAFLLKNKTKFNNDDFVINLYTSNDYRYINNYLREGKISDNSKYTEDEIKSWVYYLHKSLTKRKSNVENTSIFYRGVNRKFPDLGVGTKFILSEFTSVSEDKKVALSFAGKKTLFVVRIEKNDYPHYYCESISNLSEYPNEKEILITSNCTFHITKKEFDPQNSVEVINLTCEGYLNK